ncbi:glycosyltransferase family 4 protein [Marinobacter lipolyticus]|uniref:glycosyltransferase n=1 Tax=Marinobacter lipolyticus TaxID=209639 RepID=UPI001BCF9D0E|nr:glycosyltransferase [Marinobacter lipolyticus]MBS8240736.1 glycosyltransferase family 4 protein [Marinobacter lipolyticus]
MRILHVVHDFSGVTETFVRDQVSISSQISKTVLVISRVPYRKKSVTESVESFRFLFFFRFSFLIKILYRLGFWRQIGGVRSIQKAVQKLSPDVVHCHFGWSVPETVLALKKTRYTGRLVVSLHGTDVRRSHSWFRAYHAAFDFSECQFSVSVITPSHFLRYKAIRLMRIPSSLVHVLPNPVNEVFFSRRLPGDAAAKTSAASLKVLSVGRLIRCKGHDLVIEAIGELRDKGLPVQMTIIGSGDLRDELDRLVRMLGLDSQISFIGDIAHADIPAYYAANDVLVQASRIDTVKGQEESFGLAVAEAAVMGLPVVVSDVGGLPDTAQYASWGRVFKEDSVKELVGALLDVRLELVSPKTTAQSPRRIHELSSESFKTKLSEIYSLAND